jgi:2,4-dienoyl-CoA reductase-like NADH-dependent reductase (Old Yellow Enzyme family)
MRLSASDWIDGAWDLEQTTDFTKLLKQAGAEFHARVFRRHFSATKNHDRPGLSGAFRQTHQARSTGLPTIAVGLITEPQHAEEVLQADDADMVALGRSFLYKPRWGWEAAAALGGQVQATQQYWRSLPREAAGIFGDAKIGMR